MRANGICITQNLFWKMTRIKFFGIFRYNESSNLSQTTRPSDSQKKKKKKKRERTCRIVDFAVPANHWVEQKENGDKYLNLARELKKTKKHESDGDTNCNWCAWYSH